MNTMAKIFDASKQIHCLLQHLKKEKQLLHISEVVLVSGTEVIPWSSL